MKAYNIRSFVINNKGFTLIELMVTITLIVIVLSVAFSMQSFSYGIFDKGSSKADIQSNLRINANFISEKIRYASNVSILATKPSTFDIDKEYIYSDSGLLKYYSAGSISTISGNLEDVRSTLVFTADESDTVHFTINGTFKNESYPVDSSAYLLNAGGKSIIEPSSGTAWSAIEFTAGVAVDTDINARPVISISIINPSAPPDEIGPNNSLPLTSSVTPSDASKKTVSWSVIGGNATISSTDHISAILTTTGATVGNIITVRAVAEDGLGAVKEYQLTVVAASTNNPATSVSVNSYMFGSTTILQNYIFKQGGKLDFKAVVTPSSASQSVSWTHDKGSGVALIDSAGLLTTTSANFDSGNITVTATTSNGVTKAKTVFVVNNLTYGNNEIQKTKSGNTFSFFRDGVMIPLEDAAGVAHIKCQLTKQQEDQIVDTKESDSNSVTFSDMGNAKKLILTYTTLNGETKVKKWDI